MTIQARYCPTSFHVSSLFAVLPLLPKNLIPTLYSHYAENGVLQFDGMETLPPSRHRRVDIETWEDETVRWGKAVQITSWQKLWWNNHIKTVLILRRSSVTYEEVQYMPLSYYYFVIVRCPLEFAAALIAPSSGQCAAHHPFWAPSHMVGSALLIFRTSPSHWSDELSGKEVTTSWPEPLDHSKKIRRFYSPAFKILIY